ncbi:TrmB family transcriptional regulator [Halosegnis rubeus]|uniref:TrmB family transcriptional regulator n=1 Tax=Halosegnis rubeus TaxID=2212850 RepID=A0A5N5U7G6_9EURY|nr:helix-turn-helix domain-containing protein [Halosegnis rubeus]KAB7514514.1 TrmB family transcriptional regulator [Halosegnis rubeus]
MDADGAVDALTELGLSTYAARTFIGLQQLGVASASDIAAVTDVPRSQVYGATDELESLGLVDVQAGSPQRYRSVDLDRAHEILRSRLEATTDRAFSYLESIQDEQEPSDGQEAIWTTEGTDSIAARVAALADDAGGRIFFATSQPRLVEGNVLDALVAADARGVDVIVVSADDEVRALVAETGISVEAVDRDDELEISIGRVFVADGSTVLLSVLPTAEIPHVEREAAFWSVDTGFAMIIAGLVREQFADA